MGEISQKKRFFLAAPLIRYIRVYGKVGALIGIFPPAVRKGVFIIEGKTALIGEIAVSGLQKDEYNTTMVSNSASVNIDVLVGCQM